MTLALDVPFKRPQKRALPSQTAETVQILEQLAGILSLAVLKTKDRQMLSRQWQESSQQVRLLANLITRWVFENFEIRSFQKTLNEAQTWISQTNSYLKEMLEPGQSKEMILDSGNRMAKQLQVLHEKYEAYYSEPLKEIKKVKSANPKTPDMVHEVITDTFKGIIQRNQNPKHQYDDR